MVGQDAAFSFFHWCCFSQVYVATAADIGIHSHYSLKQVGIQIHLIVFILKQAYAKLRWMWNKPWGMMQKTQASAETDIDVSDYLSSPWNAERFRNKLSFDCLLP